MILCRGSVALCVLGVVLGCASSGEKSPTTTTKDTWSTQSFVDKHETMTFVVLPNMGKAFAKFRGDKVPKLRCVSCHGENAEQVKYKMPNDAVRALDPAHVPGVDDGPWPKFMIEDVMPAMKEMTGDPNVTCFTCHARAKP